MFSPPKEWMKQLLQEEECRTIRERRVVLSSRMVSSIFPVFLWNQCPLFLPPPSSSSFLSSVSFVVCHLHIQFPASLCWVPSCSFLRCVPPPFAGVLWWHEKWRCHLAKDSGLDGRAPRRSVLGPRASTRNDGISPREGSKGTESNLKCWMMLDGGC